VATGRSFHRPENAGVFRAGDVVAYVVIEECMYGIWFVDIVTFF